MKALARFEAFVENLIEGPFAHLPGSSLQPVQIAKAISRAMEDGQSIGPDRVYVPNQFVVELNGADYAALQAAEAALARELAGYAEHAAREQGWSFLGPVTVTLRAGEDVKLHRVRVRAERAAGAGIAQLPSAPANLAGSPTLPPANPGSAVSEAALVLQQEGAPVTIPLTRALVTLGRELGNDVVLGDASVSRRHAELRWEDGHWYLIDLGSTNGTFVGGVRISRQPLRQGDRLRLGAATLDFRAGPPVEGTS